MAEAARILPMNDQNQSEKAPDNGKSQLPGESALWFRRYCLYRDLGNKRSLRAAVAKERETARLVKESESATKSTKSKKSVGVTVSPSGQQQSKATISPAPAINGPGSWKNASKVYHWAERALAFDNYLIEMMVITTTTSLGDTYANKFKRVQLLDLLIKNALSQVNHAMDNATTHDVYLSYLKQIAALTAQMEREMSGLSMKK